MNKKILLIFSIVTTLLLSSCDNSFFYASITLPTYDVELAVGESYQMTAEVTGAKTKDPVIQWTSGADSIATVTQTGLITGIAPGNTEVIAETIDGSGGKTVCLVTVK